MMTCSRSSTKMPDWIMQILLAASTFDIVQLNTCYRVNNCSYLDTGWHRLALQEIIWEGNVDSFANVFAVTGEIVFMNLASYCLVILYIQDIIPRVTRYMSSLSDTYGSRQRCRDN
jgi:hypothetical protein